MTFIRRTPLEAGASFIATAACPNLLIKSGKRAIYLAIELLDYANDRIRFTSVVALDVTGERFFLFVHSIKRGPKMPQRRTPCRCSFRKNICRALQMVDGFFKLILIEKRPTRNILDASAQKTGEKITRSLRNVRRASRCNSTSANVAIFSAGGDFAVEIRCVDIFRAAGIS